MSNFHKIPQHTKDGYNKALTEELTRIIAERVR